MPLAGPLGPGVTRVHMVGIAGAGMEGLARLLQAAGYRVTGSDTARGAVADDLRRCGIPVHTGHDEAHVGGADLLVYSAAVGADNPERGAARRRGIPERSRAVVLGALSRRCATIAIAGTHGKTTTASLVVASLRAAGRDPAVAVGGWAGGRTQTAVGDGRLLVAEADEYARSFLELSPWLAVVTNIEPEHVDVYADEDALVEAFSAFLARVRPGGRVVVNGDDPRCLAAARGAGVAPVTFGFDAGCDVRAEAVALSAAAGSAFEAVSGSERVRLSLRIAGRHNVANALAAAAVARLLDVDWDAVTRALAGFGGVDRRFQRRGAIRGVDVVDDYAHHPTAVAAALATARYAAAGRLLAVFQPHTYSRTRHFRKAFADALSAADEICVTAVYAAREEPDDGLEGDAIVADLHGLGREEARYEPDAAVALSSSLTRARPGDLLLVMGAGDIGAHLDALLARGA